MKEKLKKISFKFIISFLAIGYSASFGIICLYYLIMDFKVILKEEHTFFIPFVTLTSLSIIITSFIAQNSILKKD